jgi:hypothetical protein
MTQKKAYHMHEIWSCHNSDHAGECLEECKAVSLTVLTFKRSMLTLSLVQILYMCYSPQDSCLYKSYTYAHQQTGSSQNALKYKVTTTLLHTQNNFQVRHSCCIVLNYKYKPYTVKHNSINDFIKVYFLQCFVRHVSAPVMNHFQYPHHIPWL